MSTTFPDADRGRVEILKMIAETQKLVAEQGKLQAEQAKLARERVLLPVQLLIGAMAAGGALVGGTIAFMKLVG